MSQPVLFYGGDTGTWQIVRVEPVAGVTLPPAKRLAVIQPGTSAPASSAWRLRGTPSYERYVNRREHEELAAKSPPFSRPEAAAAALIPIRKSEEWWKLSQDQRRAIFEEK